MNTTVQEKVEIARIIVAAIEKHARGGVEALARGIIAELHKAGYEILPTKTAQP